MRETDMAKARHSYDCPVRSQPQGGTHQALARKGGLWRMQELADPSLSIDPWNSLNSGNRAPFYHPLRCLSNTRSAGSMTMPRSRVGSQ